MTMKKHTFTLVELLTTIAIILVLASILLAAVNGAIKKAEAAKAKSQIVTLLNAIKQFEATYGYLPSSTKDPNLLKKDSEEGAAFDQVGLEDEDDTDDNNRYKKFIGMLQGHASCCDKLNKRKIKFLDKSTEATDEYGEYSDPWDKKFKIRFDVNHNGHISGVPGVNGGVYADVVVWSAGPDDSAAKDNIYSINVIWNKKSQEWELAH